MQKQICFLIIPICTLLSNPTDPKIRHGSADIRKSDSTLTVYAKNGTVIDWDQFSVHEGESSRFILDHEQAKILNRVTGLSQSEILGHLESNGHFYLINPNGILIGPNAIVNTKTALFSTLDLCNDDFLKGDELRLFGTNESKIVNEGKIEAENQLVLVSRVIENTGTVSADGKVTMVAGEEVLIKLTENSFYIRLKDGLSALKGLTSPYDLAVAHDKRSVGAIERNGRIYLSEGTITGGEVEVQGDVVEVGAKAHLIGDQGTIFVIGNDLSFYGSAAAKDGFIEISGHRSFDYHPQNISTGTLLLDPNDIIIQAAMATSGGFSNPYSGATFQPAYLMISDLVGGAGLLNNDVIVLTNGGTGGGTGDITISDPITWSSSHSLTLLPSRDLQVNALVTSTGSGAIAANAGRDINIGTSLSTVPAGLVAETGAITLTTTRDLNLTGGTSSGAYGEISSVGAAMTATIGRGVNLTGGTSSQCYAQIGKGIVPATVHITSGITFISIGGNVTLNGGSSGNDSYAQIGHAPNGPGNHTIVSSINFPSSGIGGSVDLTGNSINCSAIIGHGNELSNHLVSITGAVNVFASNGVNLNGGGSSGSHAVIGFQDPHGGTPLSCTSTGVSVQNFIMGDITLNAGSGSNAVIGYYNNSVIGGGPTLTITLVDVEVPITLNVNLNGGDAGGISNGVAAIGTLANEGIAQSGIKIVSGTLKLNTVAPVGDGSARIVNCLPTTTVSYDVNINCGGIGPVTTLLGGTTSPLNFAEIYSGRNLILNFGGNLIVNTTAQKGYSQIRAYSTLSLNPSLFGGTISLAGSSTDSTGLALIQSLHDGVKFGTQSFSGGTDISIGDPTSIASSKIVSDSGASLFNTAGGDFTLDGGTGAFVPSAEISSRGGTLSIIGKNMTLNGGSGPLAYAQIASTLGDVTITLSGNLLLQGGSAANAYAQIGKGNISSETSVQSNLFFPLISGSVQIIGGSASGAYAQIGHSPINNLDPISVNGNIDFTPSGIGNFLTLRGGTATDATAILGFGNEVSSAVSGYTGNIVNLIVSNNITLQCDPGLTPRTHAIIGFHSPSVAASSPFTITSATGIFVKSISGSISGTAENGANATIGYYNATNTGVVNGSIEEITVNANSTITFQAGNNGGTGAGVAAIGTFASSGSSLFSNIEIDGTTVSLLGPTGGLGGNNGSARIVNSYLDFGSSTFPSAAFDIVMNVTDLLVYGGTGDATGFADIYSAENLTLEFTNNFEVNNSATLQNGYAHVIGYNNIDMGNIGNLVSVIGGALFSADARIECVSGNLSHGGFQSGGAFNIHIGQSNSLSTSQVITAGGTNSINAASDFVIQGGAGTDCVSLVRTDSGPFFVSGGQNMTITGGTGGNFASAEIRSLSGNGQVAAGNNMTLLGGGNNLCFAQINSDTGSITFPSIGSNLTLTGGPGAECYAQIGKGFIASATIVLSNLTFSNIGNNATLTGSPNGIRSYAQIGHSPYYSTFVPQIENPINVQGNIAISEIGGKLTLNGGTGTAADTTAIIGHGNELTSFISNCTGTILVTDSGVNGIELIPGAPLLNTHAVIGFHSPAVHPNNMVTFHVTSSLLQVSTSSGPLVIQGGDRENGIIGYYNQTTPVLMPPGVNVDITNITVKCGTASNAANNITLQAGNDAGSLNGVAIIGTSVATGNTAVSTINIQGNILNVLGPTGTNDGEALVTNNRTGEINPLNVTLNMNTTNVFGGTGASTGLAEIYSSGLLFCNFRTALNVGVDPALPGVLAKGNSYVRAYGNITMNQTGSTGDITVVGGATAVPLIESAISTEAGGILIGNTNQTSGAQNITVGSSLMQGPARIFTATGDLFAVISGNGTVIGGANNAAFSEIEGHTNLTFNAAGTIEVIGGSALNAVGRISSSFGKNGTFGRAGVILTGGVGLAEIRNFGFDNRSLILQSNGDITINANARILNSGGGRTNVVALNNLTLNGDGFIQNVLNGPISTFSGVSTFMNDTSKMQAARGNLTIVVDNDYPVPPEMGPGRFVSASGAEILSLSNVRIFTAKRSQNSIDSLINGTVYVPGIEFIDTATEKWRTYFNSNYGGTPFTLFYKDFIPVGPIAPIIVINSISASLFTQDLRNYDYLIMEQHPMDATYLYCSDWVDEYQFWRQLYRNYNLKSIDPLD